MRLKVDVYALQYEWQDTPSYFFFHERDHDTLLAQEYVYICSTEIELEALSDGLFRARQIDSLKKKKDALRDTFLKESEKVDERIQNLLAIGHDQL